MRFHRVSEPDHVRQVLRRTDDFLPTNALTSVVPLCPEALRVLSAARFALPPVLASATGDAHLRVRRLVAGALSPAAVAALAPRVRDLTKIRTAAVAEALERGPVDLADAIAKHVPPIVMGELIGVPCPDLDVFKRWSRDSLELFWGWPDDDRQVELAHSAAGLYGWLRDRVDESAHAESLFGVLHRAGLSRAEICSLGYFLVIAGQETTSQLIATTFHRALQNPRTWRRLAGDATAAAPFVQGVLATESSVFTWRRTAAHDTVLEGAAIPAGAEILLELTGHHGADARPGSYALAFGHGLHRCLGARLAELETTLVLAETARALPDVVRRGEDPEWLRLLSFQAPLSVTVARRR